mgnify:CR=1 FL=1
MCGIYTTLILCARLLLDLTNIQNFRKYIREFEFSRKLQELFANSKKCSQLLENHETKKETEKGKMRRKILARGRL